MSNREDEMAADGCNLHPACLSCPFPRCQYESKSAKWIARDRKLFMLASLGFTQKAIAAQLGLATQTVYRKLKAGPAEAVINPEAVPGYILPLEQLTDRLRSRFKAKPPSLANQKSPAK